MFILFFSPFSQFSPFSMELRQYERFPNQSEQVTGNMDLISHWLPDNCFCRASTTRNRIQVFCSGGQEFSPCSTDAPWHFYRVGGKANLTNTNCTSANSHIDLNNSIRWESWWFFQHWCSFLWKHVLKQTILMQVEKRLPDLTDHINMKLYL